MRSSCALTAAFNCSRSVLAGRFLSNFLFRVAASCQAFVLHYAPSCFASNSLVVLQDLITSLAGKPHNSHAYQTGAHVVIGIPSKIIDCNVSQISDIMSDPPSSPLSYTLSSLTKNPTFDLLHLFISRRVTNTLAGRNEQHGQESDHIVKIILVEKSLLEPRLGRLRKTYPSRL